MRRMNLYAVQMSMLRKFRSGDELFLNVMDFFNCHRTAGAAVGEHKQIDPVRLKRIWLCW